MIIYHPLTDVYHAINRAIVLSEGFDDKGIEFDRYSIYDYYMLFPQDLRKVSLPLKYKQYKKVHFENKYNIVKSPKTTYRRLKEIQQVCINCLIMYGVVDGDLYRNNKLVKFKKSIDLNIEVAEMNDSVKGLISEYFNMISIRDLKERTKLTEYRYEQSQN